MQTSPLFLSIELLGRFCKWESCTVFEPSWSCLWPLRPSYSAKANSGLFITGASWHHHQVALLKASYTLKLCASPVAALSAQTKNEEELNFWSSATGTTTALWLITTPGMLSQRLRMEVNCASLTSCRLISVSVEGDSSARATMLT